MTALYIILGILGFIILLLICPIRIRIVYDGELRLRLGYLFLNFNILPKEEEKHVSVESSENKSPNKPKKKDNDLEKLQAEPKRDNDSENAKPEQEKKTNPILEFKDKHGLGGIFGIVKNLLDILAEIPKKLSRHLVIKLLDVKLLIVGQDSADTAIKYGYACSVIYPIVSILKNNLKIKKDNEEIVAGFLADETAAEFTFYAGIKPWFLLGTEISAFVKFISAIAKLR